MRALKLAALAAMGLSVATVGCQVTESPAEDEATSLGGRFLVVQSPSRAETSETPGSVAVGSELATVSAGTRALSASDSSAPAARPRPVAAFQTKVAGTGYLAARLRSGRALLRTRPGGRVIARLAQRTEFGSIRVVAVIARAQKGRWLKVIAPELANNAAAWVDAKQVWLYRVPVSLVADISRRRVTLYRNHRPVQTFPVAVGRPGSETPTGLFSVTDKLLISDASPYGCCVLALSGHQPRIPQGWGGGDRLGIHATDNPTSIGYPASLGCLRAPESVMRRLVYSVPLGARVLIHD